MSDADQTNLQDHLLQALAGAIMLRDRLAEAVDNEGIHLALQTVAALNNVFGALSVESPTAKAQMLPQQHGPAVPGFAAS